MNRQPRLAIGSRIEGYEVVGVLGAGGMGEVYRAHDSRLRRDVAVKVLPSAPATDPDSFPAGLDLIVRHCLEKEPGKRFQAARDVALALDAVSGMSGAPASTATPPPPHRRRGVLIGAIAAGSLACGALGIWLGRATSPKPAATALVQDVARVTHDVGFSEWPTWSPDGRMFAFSSNRGGNFDIYLARVGGSDELVNVTRHSSDNFQPSFSPDGSSIAFVSTRSSQRPLTKIGTYSGLGFRTVGGDVWVISTLGGQARRLAPDGNFPVWSPDGHSVAYVSGNENHRAILSVPVDGGAPRSILAPSASSWEITAGRRSGC
jgi:serine/threonine protein kinase